MINVKNILVLAGVIEILVGLLHFVMPYFAYQSHGFQMLNTNEINFVTLVIYAVGILLVAFGSVSILLAQYTQSMQKIILYYLIIKSVLWMARVVLELIYPVNLNMFFVEKFTLVILPGLVIETFLFLFAILLLTCYKVK